MQTGDKNQATWPQERKKAGRAMDVELGREVMLDGEKAKTTRLEQADPLQPLDDAWLDHTHIAFVVEAGRRFVGPRLLTSDHYTLRCARRASG
jgi:hypothetical protein